MRETFLTFQEQKYFSFSPSRRGKWERRGKKKKLLNDLFIQFSIASLTSSPGNRRVSEAHLSPWSRSMPPIIPQPVTVYAYQTPKHFERCQCGDSWSPSWWRISNTVSTAAAATGQPCPHQAEQLQSSSPLAILISLPLAKESPQFPLPPQEPRFFFFLKVVNYNSRAKSTTNFYSYLNNLIFCTL